MTDYGVLYDIKPVDYDINKDLLEDHQGERSGWYQVGPNKCLLPSKYAAEAKEFMGVETREDDIWISTFPRSGTTLTQELTWLIANNFDYATARRLNLWERSPFFELDLFFHDETTQKFIRENCNRPDNIAVIKSMMRPAYDLIQNMKSPRVIKTHFPPSLLPHDLKRTRAKVIYVARNPRDVVISYYHHLRLWRTSDYINSFEKFCAQFISGLVPWGPHSKHIQEGWERRNEENFLFLFYEDMIKDVRGTIKTVANFLNRPASDDDVEELAQHVSLENFQGNPSLNFEHLRSVGILGGLKESFIRQGVRRGTSSEFSESTLGVFEQWVEDNYQFDGFSFPLKRKNTAS